MNRKELRQLIGADQFKVYRKIENGERVEFNDKNILRISCKKNKIEMPVAKERLQVINP